MFSTFYSAFIQPLKWLAFPQLIINILQPIQKKYEEIPMSF